MALSEIIKTALDQMHYIAKTETVVGEPIQAGEVTLIPVSRISMGFAAGGAGKDEKSGSGAGTGGGINITPVAFIVVTGGKVHVQTLSPTDPVMNKVLSVAPDVVNAITSHFRKKETDGFKKKKESPEEKKSASDDDVARNR